ncbi:hypothetical protein [Neotabrizicola sp. VNH66]|uniref:hypothetical protein n=1 Tax=Neotabrizicola sp. VNH66 TaxID=3400918 RepID=UPI003C029BD5
MLIQPETGLSRALSKATDGQSGISLHPVALGAANGTAVLRVMNLSEMNSLRPANAEMRSLLPGLREVAQQELRKIDGAELLKQAGDLPDPVTIRIAAPGDEAEILQGLAAAGLLERLAGLTLRCGEVALHEGAEPRSALQTRIEEAGFVLKDSDTSDPDWPVLTFRADPNGRALKQAKERIAALEAAAGKAQAEAEAQGSALSAAQAQLAEARQETEAQKAKLKEVSGKADWRQTRIGELEATAQKTKAEAEAQAGALQARIAELEAEATKTRQEAEAQKAALTEAQATVTEARQEAAALKTQLKELSGKADWRQTRIAELEAAAQQAQAETGAQQARIGELETTAQKAQAETDAQLKALRDKVEAGQNRIGELEAATRKAEAAAEAQAKAQQARIAELEAEAAKARQEAEAQKAALTEAQATVAEARQEAAALKTQLKELSGKADWRQTRIAELEAEATKARQEAEIQLKALRDQARGHQSRIGELGAEAQEAQAAAEAQAKAQEARITELEVEAVKARQEVAALKAQLKEISEKADWRHARIGELEAAAGKTKEEANLLRKDVQERQKRQADLEHRLQLAHNDLRRAEGQIDLIKDLLLRGETL